jgi:hypothetical protein
VIQTAETLKQKLTLIGREEEDKADNYNDEDEDDDLNNSGQYGDEDMNKLDEDDEALADLARVEGELDLDADYPDNTAPPQSSFVLKSSSSSLPTLLMKGHDQRESSSRSLTVGSNPVTSSSITPSIPTILDEVVDHEEESRQAVSGLREMMVVSNAISSPVKTRIPLSFEERGCVGTCWRY